MADTVLQKEKAFKHSKQFMKQNDATNALYELSDKDDINLFNRFSENFKHDIKDQENLTPTAFNNVWERFKDKLISTDYTGINISTVASEGKI